VPSQRIKGQETTILIVQDGALQAELTDVRNFEFELQTEIKSQGYLGEKTNRKDEVYNGVKGSFELHLHSQDIFTFQNAILDRAKRNTPDTVFNISSVLNFPNGETPTVLFPDVKFGPIPLNVPERGDYINVKVQFECDDFERQLS
jgi:hypothetical protein